MRFSALDNNQFHFRITTINRNGKNIAIPMPLIDVLWFLFYAATAAYVTIVTLSVVYIDVVRYQWVVSKIYTRASCMERTPRKHL